MSNFKLKQNGAQVQKAIDYAMQVPQLSEAIADLGAVPDYIATEAERVVNAVQATRTAQTFVMACGTDMHLKDGGYPESLASVEYAGMGIRELKKRIHLDLVALLGDYSWMDSKNYTAEQTMQDIVLAKKTIHLGENEQIWSIGNHDWCYGSGTDRLLTEDEIYSYISANSDGAKPYTDIARGYGYIDFDNYKIRVVNLNTCDCKDSIDNGLDFHNPSNSSRLEFISPTQMRWVAGVALDFTDKGDGWGVIFTSHHPIDYGNPWFTDLLKVLEAYRDGSSITLSLYKYYNGTSWVYQGETFDFSSVTNKAEIICNVHGHNHNCNSAKVSSSTCISNPTSGVEPWLWRYCIPNMCVGRENSGYDNFTSNAGAQRLYGEVDESGNPVYHTKETGTAKATAFNVVSIDRKNKKIYAYIFGAGKDRVFYYGEEIITSYPITTTLNNCTGASGNVVSIDVDGSAALVFTANDGYDLPDTVSVSGASYTWDKVTGLLVLSNPTADVFVTITAVAIVAEQTNLLDMSVRTLDNSYTDNYIESTAAHTMDYTKAYAISNDNRRGAYPTTKFSDFTVTDNGFSANCSSYSGYRLEFPVNVESGKTYTFTVNSDSVKYSIILLKYNTDTTLNDTLALLPSVEGQQSATFTPENGFLYSIVFSFGSGVRTYSDISLTENI